MAHIQSICRVHNFPSMSSSSAATCMPLSITVLSASLTGQDEREDGLLRSAWEGWRRRVLLQKWLDD
jgi:hypothetical protein